MSGIPRPNQVLVHALRRHGPRTPRLPVALVPLGPHGPETGTWCRLRITQLFGGHTWSLALVHRGPLQVPSDTTDQSRPTRSDGI